jgi:hypothetical protein
MYTTVKATGKQIPLTPVQQKQYSDAIAKNGYVEYLELKSDGTYKKYEQNFAIVVNF